jgi:hypothetical protein
VPFFFFLCVSRAWRERGGAHGHRLIKQTSRLVVVVVVVVVFKSSKEPWIEIFALLSLNAVFDL